MTTENRRTAMVVHEIGTKFGVQRIEHVLKGNTELATVSSIAIRAATNDHAFVRIAPGHAPGRQDIEGWRR
ncbi:hypothetical protein D9M71_742330 [compost metagenome]